MMMMTKTVMTSSFALLQQETAIRSRRMAFFGMAYLGPQSYMKDLRLNTYTVSLFSLDEFLEAFVSQCKREMYYNVDNPTLPVSSLSAVLDIVFHGPPPALEKARVDAALLEASEGDDSMSLSRFLEVIESLQQQPLIVDEDKYAHYKSFDQL